MSFELPKFESQELDEFFREYEKKLKAGILPPDPARVVVEMLSTYPEIEHVLPIPPVIEKVHAEVVEPTIEKLPRLPMTADFPIRAWKKYRIEKV